MRRRQAIISLAASSALAWATAGRPTAQGTAPETIHVVGSPADSWTPLFYALRQGMFERAGIAIVVVPLSTGAAAAAAVISGTYEIGVPSLVTVMNAYLHDVPLRLVAPGAISTAQSPYGLLEVAADSTIKTAKDLENKTIGVASLNSLDQVVITAWVDQNGGDSKTLKFVEVPFAATEGVVAQKRVDAALLYEPVLTDALSSGKTKTLADALRVVAPRYMVVGYVARSDWASSHPQLLKKFNQVLATSAAFTNAHPAETAAMMADVTKTPLPVMQKMRRVISATTLDPALVQPLIDIAAKYSLISRGFAAKDLFLKSD